MTFIQVELKVKLDTCHKLAEDTDKRDDPIDHHRFYSRLGFISFQSNVDIRIMVSQTDPRKPTQTRKKTVFSNIDHTFENIITLSLDIAQIL
jgi:hypothetical protein